MGVSLLHRLVIDELLGCKGHPKPTYVHDVSELIEGMRGEGSQAESDSDEPYTLGGAGDASQTWTCRSDQSAQRADAGKKHLFLSKAAERTDFQSACLAFGFYKSHFSLLGDFPAFRSPSFFKKGRA